VQRDPAYAVPRAPDIERPVDVSRLDRVTVSRGEHKPVFLAADAFPGPVVGPHGVLIPLGDPQCGNGNRR
jgi:hypothetical protein